MSNGNLTGKYFVKRTSSGSWEDVTTKWNGLKILSVDGFNEQGDAENVFTQKWINSQTEDMMVTKQDGQGNPIIIRANVDLTVTFIVARRYASTTIDEQTIYDSFVKYVCKDGDFYIKSAYVGKYVHVVCLKGFKPTAQRLQRGEKSYILATMTLHCLEDATTVS